MKTTPALVALAISAAAADPLPSRNEIVVHRPWGLE